MNSGILNTADGYPTLCCKAFNGRLLLIFLDRCCHALAERVRDDPELSNCCVAVRSLTMWFDIMERSGRYLDANQRFHLHSVGIKFVRVLERLAVLALLDGQARWRLQPKLHTFIHICEDSLWYGYNPRFYHCYIDEDHIGLTKRLALKVHRGNLMELRMLCRWLLRLGSWLPSDA